MSDAVSVHIHPSQFPLAIEAAMHESLRTRRMKPQFLYDTPKQALRWLRVHTAYSPLQTDPSCQRVYEAAARAVADSVQGVASVEVISFGCGSGQKDAQLIRALKAAAPGLEIRFIPVDVSAGLTLMARERAIEAGVSPDACAPFVMDLAVVEDWRAALAPVLQPLAGRRIVTLFGMLPNFAPDTLLPRLTPLLGRDDQLLVSAYLAPGADYAGGVERVLPLYDNPLTQEWLLSSLLDLGVERTDGSLVFGVAERPAGSGLRCIEADFVFAASRTLEYGGRQYAFAKGERFRLFFSYRHPIAFLESELQRHQLEVIAQWVNDSGEEAVFACRRKAEGVANGGASSL